MAQRTHNRKNVHNPHRRGGKAMRNRSQHIINKINANGSGRFGRRGGRRIPHKPLNIPNENQVPKNDADLIAPPAYKKGTLRIVALGGLGEIGRNMNTFAYNGHILLVDCGMFFPDAEKPGVDLILPDFSYIRPHLKKVEALVLTHGHEDHIGAVPYLLRERPDIPLYGTKLTMGLVKAKCEEFGFKPICHVVDDGDVVKVGPFELEFISVTHSIPGALAVTITTPAGRVIDTGDMKMDPLPIDHRLTNLREFAKQGERGVDLLMADSTNATIKGFVSPEISVRPAIEHGIATAKRKVIVACFSSHVHRVQQVVDLAHKYGRKVVFVGRSMLRNMSIAADLGYLKLPEDTIIDLRDASGYPDSKLVYICTGSQGEPLAAIGRIANGNHPSIDINPDDTVIFASSMIPGNESTVYRVINQLTSLGARVFSTDNAKVHVSGHCDEGELLYLYDIVQPKNAMPIHGESRHQLANGRIAIATGVDPKNVIIARDGDVVDLYHGKAGIVGSVPCHYIYVDGDSVGELTDSEIDERKELGTQGFISCFVVVDSNKHTVVKGPRITLSAVAEDPQEFDDVRPDIVNALVQHMQDGEKDKMKLQDVVRRTIASWVTRRTDHQPVILPVVTDLATVPANQL